MSGTDAQILIHELLKQIFTEKIVQHEMIKFKPDDIKNMLTLLGYPFTLRNDAITAVGAPSTIGFLVKAIYWLFIIAQSQHCDPIRNGGNRTISEDD